ncbi:rhomboid family intramembrane serine protease [Prevotella sp. 10(H)]|uniref:rhomboid family intramembrane serine protease n=1 Tax=Prevotella sp. 10(H) TaxID=1158294 RepID=UPI00068FE5E6|nr:rhomboid family intramembrane serine protease [Prevotella sp. 10(H)]
MKEKMKVTLKEAKTSLEYALSILIILWIIRIVQSLFGLDFFYTLGVYPRETFGLAGIITAPLIHGNFEHLIANTLPMFFLTFLIFFFYKKNVFLIYLLTWITSGFLTWLIGRPSWHIGASSVIYAMASFLIFGGIFSRNFKLIIASVIVVVLYSGLIWGIFPSNNGVSWEGHLSGAISGLIWAYIFRKQLQNI